MLKIFLTGDNHIGLKYMGHGAAGTVLAQKRMDAFHSMVQIANEEECGLFVIAGNIFGERNVRVSDQPCIHRNALQLLTAHQEICPFIVDRFTLNRAMGNSNTVCIVRNDLQILDPAEVIFTRGGMLRHARGRIQDDILTVHGNGPRLILVQQQNIAFFSCNVPKILPQLGILFIVIVVAGEDGHCSVKTRQRLQQRLHFFLCDPGIRQE